LLQEQIYFVFKFPYQQKDQFKIPTPFPVFISMIIFLLNVRIHIQGV